MFKWIRNLNITPSWKIRSNADKINSVYKAITPRLTYDPFVNLMHTRVVVDGNLKLKISESGAVEGKRNLAIILSWLGAKPKHIDNYVKVYTRKGFDVLTADTTFKQLLFPRTGIQVTAANILDFVKNNEHYDNVLIHAFSVGSSVTGEVLTQLQESEEKYSDFTKRVAGVIFDSAVDVRTAHIAIPASVTRNLITYKIMQKYIQTYMVIRYNAVTKLYIRAWQNIYNMPLRCPTLIFFSTDDQISTSQFNQQLANAWRAKGIDVSVKYWENSRHVSHMHYHKNEYLAELDVFLRKLNLGPT